MSDRSAIEWTEATWNPVTGCTKVSPGCAYCYAERITKRFGGAPFLPGQAEVREHGDRLDIPLRWKKPRLVFVNSMSDLFHEEIPDSFIAQVWQVMAETPQHTYQVLTKRPERMRDFVERWLAGGEYDPFVPDVPPNVWLGVSVENQRWAEARVPLLLETPAAVRFLSCEPLLERLELIAWLKQRTGGSEDLGGPLGTRYYLPRINWVIAGGESGGPARRALVQRCEVCADGAPPGPICHQGWRIKGDAESWVRSIKDQCWVAGVPFFFKQWGGPTPRSGGRELDGRTWDEMPARIEAIEAKGRS